VNRWTLLVLVVFYLNAASDGQASEGFTLTSSTFENGGDLPADLKCMSDGGDGVSPPLTWSSVPEGTQSIALIMHHYPRGKTEGVDAPSQYWLLWNIPVATIGLERGNPLSIGFEGSDKNGRHTGYTSPCSPAGRRHEYVITVYALSEKLESLPAEDNLSVDWLTMTGAMQGKILDSSEIMFFN